MEANNNFIENNSTQMRRGVLEYSILLILALEDELPRAALNDSRYASSEL